MQGKEGGHTVRADRNEGAALESWSDQLFDLTPLLFQCGPNNAVLIVLLAASELPYVGY